MTYHNVSDTVDFESAIDFSKEISSSKLTRFERKRREAAALQLRKPSSAPMRRKLTPGRKHLKNASNSSFVSNKIYFPYFSLIKNHVRIYGFGYTRFIFYLKKEIYH